MLYFYGARHLVESTVTRYLFIVFNSCSACSECVRCVV